MNKCTMKELDFLRKFYSEEELGILLNPEINLEKSKDLLKRLENFVDTNIVVMRYDINPNVVFRKIDLNKNIHQIDFYHGQMVKTENKEAIDDHVISNLWENYVTEDNINASMYVEEIVNEDLTDKLLSGQPFYIYELDGKIIGFISFYKTKYKNQFIKTLYVDKEYRNRGVAREMIKYVEIKASIDHCKKIYLTVWTDNKKAINLYESEYFYRVKEKVEKF